MNALLAAMQRGSALRAVSSEVGVRGQRHRAAKAARGHDILHEPRKLRARDVKRQLGALRLGPVTPIATVGATF